MDFVCFCTVTEEQISTCGNRNTWEVLILNMLSLTTTYSRSEIAFWTNVVTQQKVKQEHSLFWQCGQSEFCFILFADLSSSSHNRHHLFGAMKKTLYLWKRLANAFSFLKWKLWSLFSGDDINQYARPYKQYERLFKQAEWILQWSHLSTKYCTVHYEIIKWHILI